MKWSLFQTGRAARSGVWVSLLALAIMVASVLFIRVKNLRSSGAADGRVDSGGFSTSATLSNSVVAAGSRAGNAGLVPVSRAASASTRALAGTAAPAAQSGQNTFITSLFSDRTHDHLTVDMAAARAFAGGQRDSGSPGGASVPPLRAGTPTFKTGASGTPALGGGVESISIVVMSDAATSALVDVELYSPSAEKLYQQVFDDQAFVAGKARTFTAMWHPSPSVTSGVYVVKVGVFSPGWGTMYDWNDHAADVLIGPARP